MRENAIIDFISCVKQNDYTIQDGIDLDSLENITFSVDNN
jgi:hypothetical protein